VDANQTELFGEIPLSKDPRAVLAEFRVGEKIIAVPLSFWKDGRARYDLTSLGGDFIMSRNISKAEKLVEDELCEIFQTAEVRALEAVRRRFREEVDRRHPKRLRIRKKDFVHSGECFYANPFVKDESILFGKCPDWLLARRDLTAQEKLIYSRLLFPLPPLCDRYEKEGGVIFGLDQGELGKALGISRPTANIWLVKLQAKGWLQSFGNPGAKQVLRFLWKEGMPLTCRTGQQVSSKQAVGMRSKTCDHVQQQAVAASDSTCRPVQQVSRALEKRELEREEREKKPSRPWCNF
jgi:hypothetical protein